MIHWASIFLVVAALLSLGLACVRLVRGPTDSDRVVALDIFLAGGIALAVASSLLTGRTVFLDVAIGLALVGFIGTIGWSRLVQTASNAESSKDHP